MRKLVAANRNHVALAEQDVAGLVDGIGEEQAGKLVTARLHLGLDRRVAGELCLGNERQERQHELVCRRHGGVRVDHRLVRVQAASEVVHDHVVDVVTDVLGRVAVRDDLVVRDEDVGVNAHVLKFDSILKGAKVVAEVEATRRAVSGEHRVTLGVLGQVRADTLAALEGNLVASFVGHVFSSRRFARHCVNPPACNPGVWSSYAVQWYAILD